MLSLRQQNQYRARYKMLHPGWRTSGEVYESLVRSYLAPSAATLQPSVLDLGCGAGGVLELFSSQCALAVGADPHFPSLRVHRDPHTRLANAQVEHLPFARASFDLILSSWVLEHLPAPEAAFGEVARVLKPGGHFLFLTPNVRHPIPWLNRLVPRGAQASLVRTLYGRAERDTFPVHYRANTVERVQSLAAAAGLQVVSIRTVPDPTYLAFHTLLFRASLLMERLLDASRAIHLIGDYTKL